MDKEKDGELGRGLRTTLPRMSEQEGAEKHSSEGVCIVVKGLAQPVTAAGT